MTSDDEQTEGNADTRLTWNPRAACRTLEDTAFILLNSRMIRLNPVGTRIWELFENGSTVAAVVTHIVEEFDTTPEQAAVDTHVFVGELLGKELLIAVTE